MNIWQVLGIDQTRDIKTIKRGYARKLKTIDRSNDIDGFQTLRTAYTTAVYHASREHEELADESPEAISVTDALSGVTSDTDHTAALEQKTESTSSSPIDSAVCDNSETEPVAGQSVDSAVAVNDQTQQEFGAQNPREPDYDAIWAEIGEYLHLVETLLADDQRKFDPSAWEPLWVHPLFDQLVTKELLYDELFAYFARVTPSLDAITDGETFMPEFVLPRYDELFTWSADEMGLARRHDEDDVDRLLILASHRQIQSQMQTAEQDISKIGRLYILVTGAIILAMLIRSWFF